MAQINQNILYYGSPHPLPEQTELRAGALSMIYENGVLRYIRLGQKPVLHQIYAAVRDHNWGTIPPDLSDIQMAIRDDSFRIAFTSTHRQNDIDFVWQGVITGTADSTLTFSFDGEARSTFRRNRIGFCVLHPMECAGLPCEVEYVDNQREQGRFPDTISPHQPFFNLRAISHEVIPGVTARVLMEGDTFEMEDQRNWTDSSYKTYCTPLGLPFPATVQAGDRIQQQITLTLSGDLPPVSAESQTPEFRIIGESRPLPGIGLGTASHGGPLTAAEGERLKALNLSHLRVDLRLAQPDVESRLRQAAAEARQIDAALEIALFLTDNAEAELDRLCQLVDAAQPPIRHWLIFHISEKSTRERWVRLAKARLGAYGAPVAAGTDAFFTELNRERPPLAALDCVTYSLNPQVHAFDNGSLVETLAAQAETVRSAQAFAPGKPVIISPVTLQMRWNPNATGPQPDTPPGQLPPQVDVRQMSLFGAGWTAISIKYLAESGAHSLTYYETTGWRGVMETEQGSPLPDQFVSIAGGVYPMYHALAAVGDFAGGDVIISRSSQLLRVDSLVLKKGERLRVLLVNFTSQSQSVTLPDLRGDWQMIMLEATNAEQAMRYPEDFHSQQPQSISAGETGLRITLGPFALARLDGMTTR